MNTTIQTTVMPTPINNRNTEDSNPFGKTFDGVWKTDAPSDDLDPIIDVPLPLLVDNQISPTNLVVGRLNTADIRVMDPLLSRQHFEFVHQDGRWFVRDLGSKNGAALNGVPLTSHLHPVEPGHRIIAGTTTFLVTADENHTV